MSIDWRKEVKRSDLRRRAGKRPLKEAFLIVCEGEKTEPYYFESFRVGSAKVHVLGLGFNTLSLVKEAVRLKDAARSEGYQLDQVWCVFDKDAFPARDVNEAFALAKRKNIRIAYSNEAFELWYILRFEPFVAAWSRDRYKKKLTDLLGFEYQKNDKRMYEALLNRQKQAMQNAASLLASHDPYKPAEHNPSTTVHLLVAELNKFLS